MEQLRIKDVAVNAPMLSIAQIPIPKSRRAAFVNFFDEKLLPMYQKACTEGNVAYGWKQEPSEDIDEFVVIAPWKDLKQHAMVTLPEGIEQFVTGEPSISHVQRVLKPDQ